MSSLTSYQVICLVPLLLAPLLLLYKWVFNGATNTKKILRKENPPPSPRKLPILGNLHQLGQLPHRSLQKLAQQHGPLMLLRFGSVPVLVASSPEAAREIMKTHDLTFSDRPKASIPDKLFYGSKEIAFTPYGEYWRQVRSICVVHLLSHKRVQSFQKIREEETSNMVEKIAGLGSREVDLTDELVMLTNDVICRVALGRKYSDDGEKAEKFKRMLREFAEVLGTFNVGDYIPWLSWVNSMNGLDEKVERVGREFDEFLRGVVEEHREKKKKNGDGDGEEDDEPDFLDILLKVQRENIVGFPIQDETIKAIIWDMFAAGTDTTRALLNWAMAELLHNPKSMEKLQYEVRQIAHEKQEITEEDLSKMPYLKAVFKETLRLHAPVPLLVPRRTTRDVKLMDYDIRAGTQVLINAWAIGRDPTVWNDPEEFKPERFLHNDIDFKGFDFELIPFGAGRRGCPGIPFATIVNEIALAKLVHKFDFVLPNGLRGEDLDMSEGSGITIQKKSPLVVVATKHRW